MGACQRRGCACPVLPAPSRNRLDGLSDPPGTRDRNEESRHRRSSTGGHPAGGAGRRGKLPSEFTYDFQDGVEEAFRFQHRPHTDDFANLIGEEYEEAMLQRELLTSSEVAIKVPVSHVYDTIHSCFDKQRYQQQNDGEYRAALRKIGLRTKTASVMPV